MRRQLVLFMTALGFVSGVAIYFQPSALAVPCTGAACISSGADNAKTGSGSLTGYIDNITNILLFLTGAAAVIAIVIGGFKMVTANGNADTIKNAKNMILYAVIGIGVAIMAYAIVKFVAAQFK